MIKVFIVDDEPVILRTIKKMITDSHPDFEIVGEALNGKDALPLIEALQPDVLFTDIQMPLMNGLALMEALQKRGIYPQTVLLTGYAEFKYAKKAITLGAVEYLLKPLSYEALEDLLDSLYDKWNHNEKEQQLAILREIISDHTGTPKVDPFYMDKYFKNLKFAYILFCSGSYCIFSTNWITPAKSFWLTNYYEHVLEVLIPDSFHYWTIDGPEGNEKILILAAAEIHQDDISSLTATIFDRLIIGEQQITAISGRITGQLTDIGYMIQMSRLQLHQNIVFARSKIIEQRSSADAPGSHITITPYESTLIILARNAQSVKFLKEIRKILEEYRKRSVSQLNIEILLKKILTILTDTISERLQSELYQKHMELDELISNVADYDSLADGVCFIVSDLFKMQKNTDTAENDSNQPLLEVETYIRTNYTKPISINNIAEIFGFTQSQLSNVFKKYKGIPPSTFLIQLRMEKAKELLLIHPHITLREIAVSVGYEDPFYFSRIFKLSVGVSPTEYRTANSLLLT